MKTFFKWIGVLIVLVLMMNSQAYAQKGTGNQSGIARQFINPDIQMVTGELDHIKTGPCENTTGHAYIGTHLFLITDEGETLINIHLGPADVVDSFVDNLEIGQAVEVQVFQTDDLKQDEYIAKQVTANGETLELRDENLRPIWAGSQRGGIRGRGF